MAVIPVNMIICIYNDYSNQEFEPVVPGMLVSERTL